MQGGRLTKFPERFKQRWRRLERLLLVAASVAMAVLIGMLVLDLLPLLRGIIFRTHSDEMLVTSLRAYGVKSYLVMIALQALQVLSMVLPTVAIQVVAGLAFGTFRGLLVCLAGDVLGNAAIFIVVRHLRRTYGAIDPVGTDELCEPVRRWPHWNFSFIVASKRPATLAFLLFLIPGVPNGVLPYVFAKSRISLPRYLLSVAAAMTPNILVSTAVGDLITAGFILPAVLLTAGLLAAVAVALLQRHRIMAFLHRFSRP